MAAFAVVTVCSSCSKDGDDDGSGSINSKDLIGTWKEVASKGYEIEDGEKDSWDDVFEDADDYWGLYFNADGTGGAFNYYGGKMYYDGGNFKWSVKGNSIKLTGTGEESGYSSEWKIKSLNSNTLEIIIDMKYGNDATYQENTFIRID